MVGSAGLCLDQDIYPASIAKICGAALNYDHKGDESALRMQETIRKKGIEKAVTLITGLQAGTRFCEDIIASCRYFKSKRKKWRSNAGPES